MEINFFNTYIDQAAFESVSSVLKTTFISEGKLVREFEGALEKQLKIVNPVTVNSGTSALHLALVLAGVGEGDEVIIPAQTFVATGLVVVQQKAIPVFADVEYRSGNISIESIRQKITPRTRAIIPVHWGGYPCHMDEIMSIAAEHNLVVIEDAAHALGATYKGKAIGAIGHYTCFSFQAIKHVTTSDGGAVACLSRDTAKDALIKRWFGIDRASAAASPLGERQYDISDLGYKYHMNDYAAALGLANLKGFPQRLERRLGFAKKYDQELQSIGGLQKMDYASDIQSAYWLYPVLVEKRDAFIAAMKSKGVTVSVVHQRIDRNSIFGGLRDLPEQKKFDAHQVHIPIHDGLDDEKVDYIINCVKAGW
jgi:perosamine synthetase